MSEVDSLAMRLDRSGAQPLYVQIVQALLAEIRERRLAAGTPLPSEAQLCKRFGVARSVVRQALSVLVSEGVIHRGQGRAPTVAAVAEHRRLVQRSTGLFDQFASTGTMLRTRVLRFEPAVPPPEVAAFLGTADTWLLERLRRIDETPLAYVRTWLPRERVPALAAESLQDASLHGVLAAQYGLRPGRGRNRIRAVAADARLGKFLAVAPGSPLLLLEGQGRDAEDRPLEWFNTWHRPEQLVFDVEVDPAGEQVQAVMRAERSPAPVCVQESTTGGADDGISADGATGAAADALADLERKLSAALATLRALKAGE